MCFRHLCIARVCVHLHLRDLVCQVSLGECHTVLIARSLICSLLLRWSVCVYQYPKAPAMHVCAYVCR